MLKNLLFILLLMPLFVFSQNVGKITGVVVEKESGEAVGPVDIHYSFTNQSYAFNESALGLEYQVELGDYSAWVGGGLNAKLGDFNLGLDFGLKQSELFGNTSVLAFTYWFLS